MTTQRRGAGPAIARARPARSTSRRRPWLAAPPLALALPADAAPAPVAAQTAPPGFREEPIAFRGDGVEMAGSVLLPDGPGRRPDIVLAHGAGPGPRDAVRAEAFARRGVVALIHDKRGDGYSL